MFRHVNIDRNGTLLCDVQEYSRRHNIVYETPAKKVCDGLPLANGIMGGLVYHTDRELCMRICRTDSFDFGTADTFGAWALELEEKTTALASCGLLKITDGTPAFAWEYLNSYNMTLDLGRAEILMRAKSPLSQWKAKGYGSLKHNCIVWEVMTSSDEPLQRKISLERYGTRAFFHYYESFTRETGRRLSGILARVTDNAMLVTHQLNGCAFTTAVRVDCPGAKYETENSREAFCILPKADYQSFRVFVTTAISYTSESTAEMALRQLDEAEKAGSALYANHLQRWKNYWNRSFLQLEDEFAENFWYMNRYQMGSSCYGSFPPSVFGSLWTTLGDMRNWGHFYHWNDQMQFWPCDAWDSGDLTDAYFAYRRRMLSQAKSDAKAFLGLSGAWYSDIASVEGTQAIEPDTARNMTCGGLIALQMYRHWKHYPDDAFLSETAWPVMEACGDMYLDLLLPGDDGKYHIRDVTALEGYLYLDDTVTDWAVIRALFTALLEVGDQAGAEEAKKAAWLDRLENLFTPPTHELDGKTVLAFGRHHDGRSCIGGEYPESDMGMSSVGALMCVFPAAFYCAAGPKDTYFDLVRRTAEAYRGTNPNCGWDPLAIAFARMDMKEEAWRVIREMLETYTVFTNCMTHFSPSDMTGNFTARVITPADTHTPWGDMHEKDKGERVVYRADRFVHFYSEPEGVICTAINESLLQTDHGVIRVFPAAEDGLFRLHGEGDIMVTAQKRKGTVRFVAVESRRGGTVTLESPFTAGECVRIGGREIPCTCTEENGVRHIRFALRQGETAICFSREDHLDGSYPTQVESVPNAAPKTFGRRTVGLVRDF